LHVSVKHANSILEYFEISTKRHQNFNFELYFFKVGMFFWDTV